MNRFSSTSITKLRSCDPTLRMLFIAVLEGYDCTILEGHRDEETQNEYFRAGKSKLRYPEGKHNTTPSKALDAAPCPINWNDTKRFYHFAGYVKAVADRMGIQIRWGGDWDGDNDLNDQTFMDLVHFELKE